MGWKLWVWVKIWKFCLKIISWDYAWHPPFCSRKMSCFWILLPNACLGMEVVESPDANRRGDPNLNQLTSHWHLGCAGASDSSGIWRKTCPRFSGTNHHCPNEFDEKKGVLEKRWDFGWTLSVSAASDFCPFDNMDIWYITSTARGCQGCA